MIGGVGHVVIAIDETLMAKARPTLNGLVRPVPQQWVSGITDTVTKEFFMELVEPRDEATVQAVIERHIRPGTEIWSDQWRANQEVHSKPKEV